VRASIETVISAKRPGSTSAASKKAVSSGHGQSGYFEREEVFMKRLALVIGMVAALASTDVSAQSINLTGIYTCVGMCRGRLPAHVTQNGYELNLLTEAGVPARAWPDWFSPTSRIWIDAFNQGAVYSPDGMVIQFDSGTIWHRGVLPQQPR
jgi:hypothetical protein